MKNILLIVCMFALNIGYAQHHKLKTSDKSIKTHFKIPKIAKDYERSADAFAEWLVSHPLKKEDIVRYHNGQIKYNGRNDVFAAVFDYDIGRLDLHQCADASMYLWASYNYSNGPEFYDRLRFTGADGTVYDYTEWLKNKDREDNCDNFRRWMDLVWSYANSWSISEYDMYTVPIWDIQAGDVFVVGGFPGHAVSVVDVITDKETGHKMFMLAQSFMPAQDNHILKNPETDYVWYELKSFMTHVRTPQYTFHINDLKRWRNR